MNKRIAACLIACTFLLGGCSIPTDWLAKLNKDVYASDTYQAEFKDRWQYSTLTEDEKIFYGSLYTAVKDTAEQDVYVTYTDEQQQTVEIPGVRIEMPSVTLTHERIVYLYEAFFDDNPQFFYLDRTYSLEGRKKTDGTTYYNTLILRYAMPAAERRETAQQLQSVTQSIVEARPTTDDDYITEIYLHDQLTARCSYDTTAAEGDFEDVPHAYTAYGALVKGTAVCEGYAKAMQLLLHSVGIPATLATGTAKENNESHMWNLVTINGENYYLDPTWNDIRDEGQYTFFNITTSMLEASCTPDYPEQLPLCYATMDNAFVRNDTVIDTYERQIIAEKVAARIRQGDTTIQLRFADGKYENGVLFLKNKNLLTSMVNNQLSANDLTMWDYELWADTAQRVLTLVKK